MQVYAVSDSLAATATPVSDVMFLQEQQPFMSLVGADTACAKDEDCTDATLNKCDTASGQCTPTGAVANKACADSTKTGMSLTLGGECAADCMDLVKGGDATASVPGMHNDATAKKCTQDTAPDTTGNANNGCTPA